ncbi:S-adenosyl-L-methionine-dependent methyltransferase [Aspergillus bertholletiae]|uniref:S-adenosyl-L-methionine-dependent methyltransferase n=1 Tax=Aspergillus bertholletiae TaxID=1226010 RepID=A0A5N7B897_9EURO|nr:S-adenosyl-L-methionine-dependent methyltransferase [Aspergillus bertholletiae]
MSSTHNNNDLIQEHLDQVIAAAMRYKEQLLQGENRSSKHDLVVKAARLYQTIRGPADMFFSKFEDVGILGALRTLLEGGVFHAIPTGGKAISARDISAETGVDKDVIVRLMRLATPLGPFRETGKEEYAHTPFSEIYLKPYMMAKYTMIIDEFTTPMLRNHEFLRKHNWQHRYTARNNPYTMANNCEGETVFQHISKFPDRFTTFNEAMMAQDSDMIFISQYPFTEELSPLADESTVTIIDVGGGRGHMLRQIKESCPQLKGRFILQDKATVIAENGSQNQEHGIESMPHDFFQPEPIKGALAYYIRRCLHDWPDEPEARQILENIASAMDPEKSRMLITEYILSDIGCNMFDSWTDSTVMTFGGRERTEKDFESLLDKAGLKLVKVWRTPETSVGVIEARLK